MQAKLQTVATRSFNDSGSTANYFWTIKDVPDFAKYKAVFKYYRIRMVKITYWPTINTYQMLNTTGGSALPKPTLPRMAYIKNRQGFPVSWLVKDDNLAGFMENTQAKLVMIPTEKPISITMKPNCLDRVAEGVVQSGSSAGELQPSVDDNVSMQFNKWYSTATADDQTYYGLAVHMDTPDADGSNLLKIYERITYYVQFKGNRVQGPDFVDGRPVAVE